ncbi:hypothetical protein ACI0X9_004226, partial [Cronobacter turicensis]
CNAGLLVFFKNPSEIKFKVDIMKTLFKSFKSFFAKFGCSFHESNDRYCNDPISIADIGRKVEDKEAFFNLYLRCASESCSSFPIYLAKMIRSCRYHLVSLPDERRKSFYQFCLDHKVDISNESLDAANSNERQAYKDLSRYYSRKSNSSL